MCPFFLLMMIIAMMMIIIAIVIMMMIVIVIIMMIMIRGKRHSTPATLVWMDEHYHLVEGVCIPR